MRSHRTSLLGSLVGLLLLVVTTVVFARWGQETERVEPTKYPLLWRIEAEPPSYLFGTIHIPDPRVTTLPLAVQSALDGADGVFTELKLDAHATMKMALASMLKEGKTLRDLLPKDLYEKLDQFFRTKGLSLASLERFQVWAVEAQIGQLELMQKYAGADPLDVQLFQRAKLAKKEAGGIEKLEEQLAVFDSMTLEEQIDSLRETLDKQIEAEAEGRSLLDELTQLYLAGDADALLAYMFEEIEEDDEASKRFLDKLLFDRNEVMAERVGEKLAQNPGKSYVFAFGAAHFPGDRGVVHLLEKQGCRITRIAAPPAAVGAGKD